MAIWVDLLLVIGRLLLRSIVEGFFQMIQLPLNIGEVINLLGFFV